MQNTLKQSQTVVPNRGINVGRSTQTSNCLFYLKTNKQKNFYEVFPLFTLYQWSENYSPQAKLSPKTAFVNKVLLEYGHSLTSASFIPTFTLQWQSRIVAKTK